MHSKSRRKRVSRLLLLLLNFGIVEIPEAQAQANMQEAKVIAAYVLTMDHVTRQFRVAADLSRDPQLKTQFAELNNLNLESRIHKLESNQKLAAEARVRGISAHDLIMTSAALGPAIAVAGLIDTGKRDQGDTEQSQAFWAAAPPDHVKFYRDHKLEIDELLAEIVRSRTAPTNEAKVPRSPKHNLY